MHILLTNDDGIESPGLRAMYETVKALEGVTVSVIAPDHNWSISGHNKTMDKPLRVRPVSWWPGTAFTTDGTPADCVSLAGLGFLESAPELVISGINTGPNLGDDVTYSGTVAAAMEAHIAGYAAIAVSLDAYSDWKFETAAGFVTGLVQGFLNDKPPLTPSLFLNINIPNLLPNELQGVEVTRLGRRIYRDELFKRTDPRGGTYYWIGGERPSGEITEGTDIAAIAHHKISITPMTLDLTNYTQLDQLRPLWES